MDRFAIVQKALARFGSRTLDEGGPAIDLNRLLAHFPHRLLYEKRETRALNGAQLVCWQRTFALVQPIS